jgi:hypothetical protein
MRFLFPAAPHPLAFLSLFYKDEPFAKLRFSFKIKACEKLYHRHMVDIPVNMAGTEIISAPPG